MKIEREGEHHNWDMCNCFAFDDKHGVRADSMKVFSSKLKFFPWWSVCLAY